MKKHHLIFLTTTFFIVLFYGESVGSNLGIFGLFLSFFRFFTTVPKNKTKIFYGLFAASILSSLAYAWFGDFSSFLALTASLPLLDLKSKDRNLKSLFVLPVFVVNWFTFICRLFDFKQWIPQKKSKGNAQKLVAIVLIPTFFVFIFFAIYTHGSDRFAHLFTDWEWNINFFQLIAIAILGFFISFNYWNFAVERQIYKQNRYLNSDFRNKTVAQKPTFDFLNLDFERLSGVVSFMALNAMLLIFIITYNYEQFYELPKSPNQLSEETHERVNAVILSIIMAIAVIMFYFKGGFNFDKKAGILKISAQIWIVLNVILVVSAMAKNSEYVISYGLTYKRLGVYAFLLLSVIGLLMTFIKIWKKKTNAFLFNQMFRYIYGMILVCSFINWGGIITEHNMKRKNFDFSYHLTSIDFSERQLLKYAASQNDPQLKRLVIENIRSKQKESFLSQILFYETINTKK